MGVEYSFAASDIINLLIVTGARLFEARFGAARASQESVTCVSYLFVASVLVIAAKKESSISGFAFVTTLVVSFGWGRKLGTRNVNEKRS